MAGIENIMAALQGRGKMGENTDEEMPEGEGETEEVDPRASSADGGTLFIDKELFPEGCKVGDTVNIKATVTKHGAKYGVVPEEIAAEGGEKQGGSEEEASY